jgi:primosomal protein N' (replication factor Y)
LSSILEVAIPVPLNKTFDYVSNQKVAVGARVRVPFGRKKVIGHSKAMAVFHKIVKLVKNGVLMIIHIYAKVSLRLK